MEYGANRQRDEFCNGYCLSNKIYLHIPVSILLSRISENKGETNVITNRNRENRGSEGDRGLH